MRTALTNAHYDPDPEIARVLGAVYRVQTQYQRSASTSERARRFVPERRSLGPGAPAVLLGLGAAAFSFETATARAVGGPGRSPDHRRHHGAAQECGETLSRRGAVLSLGAVLGGADGEHGAREPAGELIEGTCALRVAQRRRRGQVERELHPGVRGVDALAARAGGVGELLDQLTRRHPEAAGRAGARGHVQIVHTTIVPHRRRDTFRSVSVGDLRLLGRGLRPGAPISRNGGSTRGPARPAYCPRGSPVMLSTVPFSMPSHCDTPAGVTGS